MKPHLYIIAAILILFIGSNTSAKTNNDLIKANYLYSHLDFHEAIGYYRKVSVDLNDPEVLSRLGDCYKLTNEPKEAANWYAKAIQLNGCPNDTKLHYAEVLMTLQQYDDAAKLLVQYQKSKPDDTRIANLISSCRDIKNMMQQPPDASIVFQNFNTDGSDFGPALRKNELFFTADTIINAPSKTNEWTGKSFYKMYKVSCDMGNNCSTAISNIGSKINTKYHDGPCVFSADGNQMYFTRTNYKQKVLIKKPVPDASDVVHLQIMIASDYDENTKKYKKVKPFVYNSDDYSTAHPAISKDGNVLIFASDMKGGTGGSDLYICYRDSSGNWTPPQNLGKNVNTEGDEMFPYISADTVLYFSSNGLPGFGGLDIYAARWDNETQTFGKPDNLGMPVNSSYDDMSLTLRDDGNTGYFASNRPAIKKSDNIYFYNKQQIFLSLDIVDDATNKKIDGSNVILQSKNDKHTLSSNDRGEIFTRLFPQSMYTVAARKNGYDQVEINISTLDIKKSDTLHREIRLKPNFNITYDVVVYDEGTHQPLDNPVLVLYENGKSKADTISLNTGQVYTTTLNMDKLYSVYGLKDNYYGNEKTFSTKGISPQSGSVKLSDTLFMKRLKVGEVYKVDNIYYDYNKANIRDDAKPSLDRLLELLNKYPEMHIQVNSHTDCRGSDAYNMHLSDARALSVIKYLQERGIKASRLMSKGYGKHMPVEKCKCENCTEQQHQNNRRTEFQIISM